MNETNELAKAILIAAKLLGNGDVNGPGAIEGLGIALLQCAEKISDSIDNLAEAIRETKS